MAQKHVAILGAGSGGYAAAFLAADKGMRVTLVDSGQKPGGVCLHRGCIPSKTLLHLAKLINETREAKNWGIAFAEPEIDIQRVRQWKNQVIDKLAGGLVMLCKQRGVNFVSGEGFFQDSNTLLVAGKEKIIFDQCVLAVGSRPVVPAIFADSSSLIMDSTSALEIGEIPRRLLIVGGGYIGLEMGTVYAALGSRVTVVEMTENLLSGLDRDLVRPLQLRLRKQFEKYFPQYQSACGKNRRDRRSSPVAGRGRRGVPILRPDFDLSRPSAQFSGDRAGKYGSYVRRKGIRSNRPPAKNRGCVHLRHRRCCRRSDAGS